MDKEHFEKQKFTYEDIVEAVSYGVNYGADEEDEKLNVPEGNIQQWLAATKKRTSEEWQNLFPDILVIDPEGWEKTEGWKGQWYREKITLQEYLQRRDESACIKK